MTACVASSPGSSQKSLGASVESFNWGMVYIKAILYSQLCSLCCVSVILYSQLCSLCCVSVKQELVDDLLEVESELKHAREHCEARKRILALQQKLEGQSRAKNIEISHLKTRSENDE